LRNQDTVWGLDEGKVWVLPFLWVIGLISGECPGESPIRVILVVEMSLKAALNVVDGCSSPFVKTLTAPTGFTTISSPLPLLQLVFYYYVVAPPARAACLANMFLLLCGSKCILPTYLTQRSLVGTLQKPVLLQTATHALPSGRNAPYSFP